MEQYKTFARLERKSIEPTVSLLHQAKFLKVEIVGAKTTVGKPIMKTVCHTCKPV